MYLPWQSCLCIMPATQLYQQQTIVYFGSLTFAIPTELVAEAIADCCSLLSGILQLMRARADVAASLTTVCIRQSIKGGGECLCGSIYRRINEVRINGIKKRR
jgi:hypothetical protein